MKKLLLSAMALSVAGTAAFAGGPSKVSTEPPVIVPVIAPIQVAPTGSWQGGHWGFNVNHGKSEAAGLTNDADGTGFALRSGYDWQSGRGVFGLGAEYDFGKHKGDVAGVSAQVKNTATISARAGYDAGLWMPYAKVGYSKADLNVGAGKSKVDGLSLGLGAEYRINQGLGAYGEYTHTDFGNVAALGGTKLKSQTLKAGLNFRF